MEWDQALLERWRYIKACAGPGRAVVIGVLASLGTIGTIRDYFFPNTNVAIIDWIPPLPWYAWTIAVLILLFAFSIEGGYRVQAILRAQLNVLNTPAVSIKLHKVAGDNYPIEKLFIEISGVGVASVRPQVFAMYVEKVGDGTACLSMAPGQPSPLGLTRGEPHNLEVVTYDPRKHVSLHVELSCKKITSDEYLVADHFRMKVCAFVEPKSAEFEFEFGINNKKLWARATGSSEILQSELRPIIISTLDDFGDPNK
jgi:hypothetical protein